MAQANRVGQALAIWIPPSRPTGMSAAIRASSYTSISKPWDGSLRAAPATGWSVTATANSLGGSTAGWSARPALVRPCDGRRLLTLGLRGDPANAHRRLRDRLSPPSRRLVRRTRDPHPGGHERQRSAYKAHSFSRALAQLGVRHLRTRPYRPRTNGKAERFIQTLLNEWAYSRVYGSSTERAQALPHFLQRYNYTRPHGSLSHQPPASRLTNVVRSYSSGVARTGHGALPGSGARQLSR
jgi:Integrase core domain